MNVEMGGIALKETRWADALGHLDTVLERDPSNARAQFGRGRGPRRPRPTSPRPRRRSREASLGADQQAAAELALARLALRRGDTRGALEHLRTASARATASSPTSRRCARRRCASPASRRKRSPPPRRRSPSTRCTSWAATRRRSRCGRSAAAGRRVGGDAARLHARLRRERDRAGDGATCRPACWPTPTRCSRPLARVDRTAAPSRRPSTPPGARARWSTTCAAGSRSSGATPRPRGASSRRARPASLVYTNPHRVEELAALEAAAAADPKDAHARHLLGNVLYGLGRRDDGLAQLEAGRRARRAARAVLAQHRVGRASAAPGRPRRGRGLPQGVRDRPVRRARAARARPDGRAPARTRGRERKALLDAHRATVDERDDLTLRWIDVTLAAGGPADLEPVRQVLLTRHFHSWEGMYGIHQAFMDVHQRLGDLALEKKDLKGALALYQKAFEYPKNLEVAPRTPDFRAHLNWSVANAYLASGRKGEARPVPRPRARREVRAARARHLLPGARREGARQTRRRHRRSLAKLEERARAMTAGPDDRRGRAGTAGWYLLSLALRGEGRRGRRQRRDAEGARARRAAGPRGADDGAGRVRRRAPVDARCCSRRSAVLKHRRGRLLLELELVHVSLEAGGDARARRRESGRRACSHSCPVACASSDASRSATTTSSPALPVSARMRPYGSRIIALPVRISSSSTPTPLLKTRKSPLSCARLGSQRISQPRPFSPRSSRSIASGCGVALVPQPALDQTHQVRVRGAAAAGLVRREQDLGPAQRGDAHVLDDVVVVADQQRPRGSRAACRRRCAADRRADRRVLEGVELAVAHDPRRPAWPRRSCCGRRRRRPPRRDRRRR